MPEQDAYARLYKFLEEVPDHRHSRGKRHPLPSVLFILLVAVLAGVEDAQAVEDFASFHEEWFRERCDLPYGIPSQDTYLRVLAMMDPEAFGKAFERWVADMWGVPKGRHVAVDGKTLRRSFDRAIGRSPVHSVAAFASSQGVVLGQVSVKDKENEIVAIPRLLRLFDIHGATITIDAMGCQTSIARTIIEGGGNYVLQVKDNQPTLHRQIKEFFEDASSPHRPLDDPAPEIEVHEVSDAGHGRVETRRCELSHDLSWIDGAENWPGLSAIAKVERIRYDKATGHTSHEAAYYIVSDRAATASQINELIRAHWSIENGLHWVLDMTFSEDLCRIRKANAAENFGIIKRIGLNLLRSAPNPGSKRGTVSIARRRRYCMMSEDYRDIVLKLAPQTHA